MNKRSFSGFAGILAVCLLALFAAGCGGVGVQVTQDKQELASMGLELLAFNGGYLLVDKYPAKYAAVQTEVAALEAVLAGSNVDAANAAFQLGIQKLLAATNNDPLVAANVSYLSKKIKFVQAGDAKPVIDIPQMKAIVENFKAGAEARAMVRR